ncbi:hypothetical protein [Pseudomonas syringae]|uniref:hypothetical protein n=1 Tax=Pseudomonas syringae TaxID=317 RepID=UPI001F415E87|nr:hypothetical protein [Pseudomonas syringae]MBL3831633.1 hypothetical protein [Pseudomonas syringae pv. theae]MBL3834595.1 hypothetical protein [Pseudomonas syringae pv. theae]MBL3869978.1 hypothetical protein [Pseudomonas syringae pv. theae]GKQ46223.1 hypothetical protein PSTH2693_13725 [Pseudomonas syringae pv. theae]
MSTGSNGALESLRSLFYRSILMQLAGYAMDPLGVDYRLKLGRKVKSFFAVAALVVIGTAQADTPPSMPETATEITPRDKCFQMIRGHADLAAAKREERILRLVAGSGGEDKNGDFVCAAQFELVTDKGEGKRTPWLSYTLFSNGDQSESQRKLQNAVNGL